MEFLDFQVEVVEGRSPVVYPVDLIVEVANKELAHGVEDHILEVFLDCLRHVLGGGSFLVVVF